jgi:hypothetical protein
MSDASVRGSCLCGSISFEIDPPFQKMMHCHCLRCRKSSGTGHATNIALDPDQFRWLSGENLVQRYDLPTAKSFSKWFCSRCGSPVPRMRRGGPFMIVPAGSLDSDPRTKPTDRIFWASRAPWSCESGGLPTHAELPTS